MFKAPNRYTASTVRSWNVDACIDGRWVPARPLHFASLWRRIKLAVGVFTGKYDVLDWEHGQ